MERSTVKIHGMHEFACDEKALGCATKTVDV